MQTIKLKTSSKRLAIILANAEVILTVKAINQHLEKPLSEELNRLGEYRLRWRVAGYITFTSATSLRRTRKSSFIHLQKWDTLRVVALFQTIMLLGDCPRSVGN